MKRIALTALLAAATVVGAQGASTINGAGATFPVPLYTKMFAEYAKKANVQVNYQGVGSGGGQRQILAQTVDFGGSDAPMTDAQLKTAPGNNRILHIPTALAPVVIAYNLPGLAANQRLRFDGPLIADIFLGKVRAWNDARVAALNPGVSLPSLPISVVHRSDGSGTTAIFVDYLAKVSGEWAERVSKGPQTSVKWPTGLGGQGNPGVAGLVKQTPGAIGYLEITFAKQNNLGIGLVRNASGRFVDPNDLKTIAAAASARPMPADARVSITNEQGTNVYPITGFTWLLVYRNQQYGNRTEAQARALVDLLNYVVNEGQQYNEGLGYGVLSGAAQARAQGLVNSINFGGKPLR